MRLPIVNDRFAPAHKKTALKPKFFRLEGGQLDVQNPQAGFEPFSNIFTGAKPAASRECRVSFRAYRRSERHESC